MTNNNSYNADQSQEIPLLVETEAGEAKVAHVIAPLTDKLLHEFDEARQVAVVGDSRQTGTETHTATAAVKLWEQACLTVRGYGESDDDLPEDWRELVPVEDKIAVIDHVLTCVALEKSEQESCDGTLPARAAWGADRSRSIQTESYFNDEIVLTSHTLRAKTAQDYAEYERINRLMFENQRSGLRKKSERLAVFPATMRGKAALYDKVAMSASGYAERIPLHHKAVVIDAYFAAKADTEKK
ncbi:MAG TPA: hypothetical protein VGO50_20505 [Pyrinomonadaceae bacterium]|jgi:hypothetical protein|nr:hypothetical protein [Pyrinomonadaceae bacterium]